MAVSGQQNTKACFIAALGTCTAHLLSVAAVTYDGWGPYDAQRFLHGEWLDHEFIINFSVWLAPIAVVLLASKRCILVCLCAIPILTIFVGRMYYSWLFYTTGFIQHKGDWASWGMVVLGMGSIAVIAVWLAVRILHLLFPARNAR